MSPHIGCFEKWKQVWCWMPFTVFVGTKGHLQNFAQLLGTVSLTMPGTGMVSLILSWLLRNCLALFSFLEETPRMSSLVINLIIATTARTSSCNRSHTCLVSCESAVLSLLFDQVSLHTSFVLLSLTCKSLSKWTSVSGSPAESTAPQPSPFLLTA